ncbi:MAG TPA: cytidylate kinase-like family protein [Candidatus Limnocylindrales bacterium]|nr:cytidylate kinase-like family protein [Candidatus Limnocylindrales bacterium]
MGFPVICISHTDGCGGEKIGHDVADRLGYRYVNEEIILEAARLARVDPHIVAAAEHKQSLLERILDSLVSAQEKLGLTALAAGIGVPASSGPSQHADRDDLRSMIRAAVGEVAKGGKAVIAAHAASLALAGRPGVLRVLVTAPDEARCSRIGNERSLSAEEAAEAVAAGDAGRREYLRSFYDVDAEIPTLYDMVLNTEILTPEQISTMIVAAAQ